MDTKTRMIIDKIKEDFSAQGRQMRQLNKIVPIKGERHVISLPGRDVDMAYYPADVRNAPLIIGLHGGGYVFGGSALDDDMWIAVCKELGVNVASLDYRKCPDYRWPAPVEDVYESACYLREHSEEFGFDPEQISVMGCSAGGNLAASACIYAKQKGEDLFKYQLLIYPNVDLVTHPSEKGSEGSFPAEVLLAFNELYAGHADAKNPLVSPLFATKEMLERLPQALIVVAEKDELQHEGMKYAQKLTDAGVPVETTLIAGMPHAFFENGYLKSTEGRDLDETTVKCLADGTMQAACADTLEFLKKYYR